MVRETRHLWVGNLPDNIREDRIREHFKRYGRVQNVKLLGRAEGATGGGGVCATVAFMDIKSASKAHNAEHVVEERTLTTEYYEPVAIPTAAGAPSAGSSPAGSGYSGSSSSVNSVPAQPSASRYQHAGSEDSAGSGCAAVTPATVGSNWRGTNDSGAEYCRRSNTPATFGRYSRNSSSAPYTTPPPNVDRTPLHRWYASGSGGGGESTPSTPGGGGGVECSGSRRRRRSGSGGGSHHSSRSSSSSNEPSSDSRSSTPPVVQPSTPLSVTTSNSVTSHSHRPAPSHQWSSSGRPLAICVRNLPARSSDSSLKDGLYHEYKKHGKVVWVKVVGQNADRYAIVRFKKPSDVEKALEVSQDKLFFGCKISVAPHQNTDEDSESAKPYETDIDEYHPKATRTLFIGNLEKDVTQQQLREKFKHFGRIIEIDIKKGSNSGAGYAFCQYASISSVVDAIRAMDGEYVGTSRVKLGFGKPVATTCVWLDGLTEHTEKQVLTAVSRCGAATSVCVDRAAGAALVHFEQAAAASNAVRELRRVAAQVSTDTEQRRLMVDYASRECQEAFYEQLEKHGGVAALAGSERLGIELPPRYSSSARHESIRFDNCGTRSRTSSFGRSSSRTPRYSAVEHYDPTEYVADRRYRSYDDIDSSPQPEDTTYEDRLQSVVVSPLRSRRHHNDSSPDEHKISKERHRSGVVRQSSGETPNRSRSGSRPEHRRRSDSERRKHRRRHDDSESRAGTPLCDELPDGPAPAEPRRPPQPRDRSHLPMSLPLPKFAAQVLRSVAIHTPPPSSAAAPASPPRPPSISSSSGGSAPHSPSLEERIRSLDEKYEKWSGSRAAAAEAAERGRCRHRLLELDINEVKPSEVVRSLLAKRSIFDEDSERLEGSVRPPSPLGSPRAKNTPRALQYPFPTHPPTVSLLDGSIDNEDRLSTNAIPLKTSRDLQTDKNNENALSLIDTELRLQARSYTGPDLTLDKSDDCNLIRHDRLFQFSKSSKISDLECNKVKTEPGIRLRNSSIDIVDKLLPVIDKDQRDTERRDPRKEAERKRKELNLTKPYELKRIQPSIKSDLQNEDERTSSKTNMDKYIRQELIDKLKCQNDRDNKPQLDLLEASQKERLSDIRLILKNSNDLSSTNTEIVNRTSLFSDTRKILDLKENNKPKLEGNLFKFENFISDYGHKIDESMSLDLDIVKQESKDTKLDQTNYSYNHCFVNKQIEKEVNNMEHINRLNSACDLDEKQCHDLQPVSGEMDSQSKSSELLEHNENEKKAYKYEQNSDEPLKQYLQSKSEKDDFLSDKNKNKYDDIANKQFHKSEKEVIKCTLLSDLEKNINCKDDLNKVEPSDTKVNNTKPEIKAVEEINEVNKQNLETKLENFETDKIEKGRSDAVNSDRDRSKSEKELGKSSKDKCIQDTDKGKRSDEKSSRHESKKDKPEKDKKKEHNVEISDTSSKSKKDDKYKHERHKKEHGEYKRDSKRDIDSKIKERKPSKDDSSKDMCRKDSTDSSASRTSQESSKSKDLDISDIKEHKQSSPHSKRHDFTYKSKNEQSSKMIDICKCEDINETSVKVERGSSDLQQKCREGRSESHQKSKTDVSEKQRHFSLDSSNSELKRKERLNSCSSLPSNIGYKRRRSSQDSMDNNMLNEDMKKWRNDLKESDKRTSKDSRCHDKHKTPKFNKGHFVKLLESKTKDDKKNQVKPPDESKLDIINKEYKNQSNEKMKCHRKSSSDNMDDIISQSSEFRVEHSVKNEILQSDIDFLATLELRSSEEDEKQKALRNEMKEKKRIQQLQQIQELQLQQDAMHQVDIINKIKDDKKLKNEEKKKDSIRDKRMSTERKSKDEKPDCKKKNRKQFSSDTSDSDEPKKHSIFDIVDDEPTYISMYDKVKARSCKNMQKQEEEKRQEKLKAKFNQLKQSRAKREEKKRSSWDEDSDSEHERRKSQKKAVASSSDEDRLPKDDYDNSKSDNKDDYSSTPVNDDDHKNKISRKNSRTRIMSDTSDDEILRRGYVNKLPGLMKDVKKEIMSDNDSQQSEYFSKTMKVEKSNELIRKRSISEHFRKDNLINLFHNKVDSDKNSTYNNLNCINKGSTYKLDTIKTFCNDMSSENESGASCKNSEDLLKRHKKKQKKQKFSLSEDETRTVVLEEGSMGEVKHKHNPDKIHKHSFKKERKRDQIHDSVDSDVNDDKMKMKKERSVNINCESNKDSTLSNFKREGKIEDIFGPLSDDEPDVGPKAIGNYQNTVCLTLDLHRNDTSNCNVIKIQDNGKEREKDEMRRKKDKKKKEKRHISKDDDNSLDVDAVGKAIEARLFADSITENNNHSLKSQFDSSTLRRSLEVCNDVSVKQGKECKEKKKKKKKNREDRQNRKDHHHHHYHHEKTDKSEAILSELPSTLNSDSNEISSIIRKELSIPLIKSEVKESPSLPRLTDSPPLVLPVEKNSGSSDLFVPIANVDVKTDNNKIKYKEEQLASVVKTEDNCLEHNYGTINKADGQTHITQNAIDQNGSEDAVKSISDYGNSTGLHIDTRCASPPTVPKLEEKAEEKPRAIISQEETEDAVAALLGESFGANSNTFSSCFNNTEDRSNDHVEEVTSMETEIIPEEDAEEMRRAVQNLNASEMELKPDTPMSDNDLLLIDTDNEDTEEQQQDVIDTLPVNIIPTNVLRNSDALAASDAISNMSPKVSSQSENISKPTLIQTTLPNNISNIDQFKTDLNYPAVKGEATIQATSTATPVITSWSLPNNKLHDAQLVSVQTNQVTGKDGVENKTTHLTANIVQLRAPSSQTLTLNNGPRSIIATSTRVGTPYQVINHLIRPAHLSHIQPPTIKIPEQHVVYQKSQGIVISPRKANNDIRLQSPKMSPQGENLSSSRLANMTILSTSQNMNSVGLSSPSSIQQRSPGHVTVVRMQQPPLSPIQAMHLPPGARTMVSPNRPNTVLVQAQATPIHFNRLPVTPVLAPLSKQLSTSNILQQNKNMNVNENSTLIHTSKIITGDTRKNDQRPLQENILDNSKIILSPTSLHQNPNATVMAQNRLISMQNAVHVANLNPGIHLSNKILINNAGQVADKREFTGVPFKPEPPSNTSYGQPPIIHVNHTTSPVIHSNSQPLINLSNTDQNNTSKKHMPIINTINSQRLLTTAPVTNVIQIDSSNVSASVLSMATIRPATVLTKLDTANTVAVSSALANVMMTPLLLKSNSLNNITKLDTGNTVAVTSALANVMMTPLLLKSNTTNNVKMAIKSADTEGKEVQYQDIPNRDFQKDSRLHNETSSASISVFINEDTDLLKKPIESFSPPLESLAKEQTDFEELLKDKTNEIIVINDPDKKLEINVGKAITAYALDSQSRDTNTNDNAGNFNNITHIKPISNSVDDSLMKDSTVSEVILEKYKRKEEENIEVFPLEIVKIREEDEERTSMARLEVAVKDETNETPGKDGCANESLLSVEIKQSVKLTTQNENIDINNSKPEVSGPETANNKLEQESKPFITETVIKKIDSSSYERPSEKPDILPKTINLTFDTENMKTVINGANGQGNTEKVYLNAEREMDKIVLKDICLSQTTPDTSKRGGRNVRGKRSEKQQDRIQTRQISKASRGSATSKRGRGRAKAEKKLKNCLTASTNLPGDIYDFHEDSGDESTTSQCKNEQRPRLILTIKSPLSGHSNVVSNLTTFSVTSKEQVRNPDKPQTQNKEDKVDDFVSPSLNTRKSRRLQEKDVQRNSVDEVIDDVIKNSNIKVSKEGIKKKPARQVGTKSNKDNTLQDVRKSPRGVKRLRNRSSSDASIDSSDEKTVKKDTKIPRIDEVTVGINKVDNETNNVNVSTINSIPATTPIPIMKPPKKMISEKLASAFESTACISPARNISTSSVISDKINEDVNIRPKVSIDLDKHSYKDFRDARNLECSKAQILIEEELHPAATAETSTESHLGDLGYSRRLVDGMPGNSTPVGAMEATEARVQSPALPHRPPTTHHPADRATSILLRTSDAECGVNTGSPRVYRTSYAASLPRGAHHPPPPLPQSALPHQLKQLPVVAPHQHHHQGPNSRVTLTNIPAVSPQGSITMGDGMYPHFSHQHYQMYQQHFRATQQDNRTAAAPYSRSLEAEGSEAPTPPLELRRPPSARVPRPAHSPSPADRLISTIGGRSPPPAHGGANASRLPSALPPPGPAGPPHASQVPREADSLQMLLRRYPVMWQGLLALKNDSAAVQMHFVHGNPGVAGDTLPRHTDGSTPPLRIAQRMRLEPTQLEQVHRKMKMENEHCMLLALPCGRDHMDVLQQSTNLTAGFITYLQRKQAAGIVNVAPPGHHQAMYTVHIFPSCDFANENLTRIAPDLMHRVADIAHLLIVIATV